MATHPAESIRRGFTLLDIMIAVAVLAIIVAFTVPLRASSDDRLRLNAAAWILTSDLEYAQVMGISDPKRPVVVRFDPANSRYWIAYADTPASPIMRPDTGEQYLVELGVGRATTAVGITLDVRNMSNNQVQYESHGGLSDFTRTPEIILRVGAENYPRLTLTIAPTTGSVIETYEKL